MPEKPLIQKCEQCGSIYKHGVWYKPVRENYIMFIKVLAAYDRGEIDIVYANCCHCIDSGVAELGRC